MLRPLKPAKRKSGAGRFAVIASKYNARYVDSMLRAARAELTKAGATDVRVVRVPGAYEIPVAAARLARQTPRFSAVICLGVILRGETTHAQHIGQAVSDALMRIQLETETPMIHEVLLLENEEQAGRRCLDKTFNRGSEAAQTALEMARVMDSLT